MKILKALWRYWTWVCVALLSTAVVLYLLSALFGLLRPITIHDDRPGKCIDAGGTWDAEEGLCKSPA